VPSTGSVTTIAGTVTARPRGDALLGQDCQNVVGWVNEHAARASGDDVVLATASVSMRRQSAAHGSEAARSRLA
jgi:hypothetical protein